MFSSKGLFSSLECPYSNSCLLPKCLFRHPKADDTQSEALPSQEIQNTVKANSEGLHDRRKFDQGNLIGSPSTNGSIQTTPHPDGRPDSNPTIRSIRRRISPPPLSRASENVTKPVIKHEAILSKPTAKLPAEAVRRTLKAEGLNPRMLKQSPASHDLRYRLVRALHDQLVRLNSELSKDASNSEETLVISDQALISMALDLEEKAATEKASIYSNVVKNNILAYKRMTVKEWKEERSRIRAQEEALRIIKTPKAALSVPPVPIDTGLAEEEELAFLPRLYTPIVGLSKHGYVCTRPSEEDINQAKKGIETSKGWEVCDRCKTRFQVFPGRREEDGALTSGGKCTYHWGKPYWQDRLASDPKTKREKKFKCCGQSIGDSAGCTQADSHVFKVSEVKRLAALLNFELTPESTPELKKAVCIDGEMGYTVYGLELIRITATSWPQGEELLDVLVRPIGEVLDLNSRFSGVWPQQITDAALWTPGVDSLELLKTTKNSETGKRELRIVSHPAVARNLLFQHLSPETPLIGHGLENDLNAARLIHPTIIDTALLFPHSAGLPYRNGLKDLALTHLHRHIQVVTGGKIDGHDSKEDARAAGDLVRWKIGREWQRMKQNGWIVRNGQFVPPAKPEAPAETPTGPQGKLSVEFLESAPVTKAAREENADLPIEIPIKSGMKRIRAEISTNDLEDGESGND